MLSSQIIIYEIQRTLSRKYDIAYIVINEIWEQFVAVFVIWIMYYSYLICWKK